MTRFWRTLRRAFSGEADADRHAALARRFPDAQVLRAQAVKDARATLAALGPSETPARDAHFSVVVDATGFGFWAGTRVPRRFLFAAWDSIGAFSTRAYRDYAIRDLIGIDGGHITHLLVTTVGENPLELAVWGDYPRDQSEALLDDYGLGLVIARLEKVRLSSS